MQTLPPDAAPDDAAPGLRASRTATARTALVLPFATVAVAGIWWAQRSPGGRRPVEFDWRLQPQAIAAALTKVPHIQWMAVIFLLALVAVGAGRAGVAALMAFLVGIGWEIAELTVRAHHARLVDLVPDLAGIALGYLVFSVVRWALPMLTSPWSRTGRLARSLR